MTSLGCLVKKMPQPIPYQGSKRNIARKILQYTPQDTARLVEPFAGSAAISIHAAVKGLARSFVLNDINAPLMGLMAEIIDNPVELSDKYAALWAEQIGNEKEFYNRVRAEFNRSHRPELLLYLLARCVKAAVRYNANGEFNQGPDNRRLGRNPKSMRSEIVTVSRLLRGRTTITSRDYRQMLDCISADTDFVYMDPPYQGTSSSRDPRYYEGLHVDDLASFLEQLNRRGVRYALSYDGHKAGKTYGVELPQELRLQRVEINAGRSSQSTLLGRLHTTYESLYLSPALVEALLRQGTRISRSSESHYQDRFQYE